MFTCSSVLPDAVGTQGGRWLSRHRTQATAVKAGQRRARQYRVDLVTHHSTRPDQPTRSWHCGRNPSTSLRAGGKIRSKDSYGNESAVRATEHEAEVFMSYRMGPRSCPVAPIFCTAGG